MARGRMLSKSLSTSEKFAAIVDQTPTLFEFCHALYPLMVSHTDDFGRLQGDPFTVKAVCYPASPRTLQEFRCALQVLHDVNLIEWYAVESKWFIQIVKFDEHQQGLRHKGHSDVPTPGGPLNASERDIEAFLDAEITAGRLTFSGHTIVTTARQVRKGNSYVDIVAHTAEGPVILIEVKRQRVTQAAIDQVLSYAELVGGEVLPVVIGHGLAVGLDLSGVPAVVGIYGDDVMVRQVQSLTVKTQHVTLSHVTAEEKRREEKGIEENRTKEQEHAPRRRVLPRSSSRVPRPRPNVRQLAALVVKEILPLGLPTDDLPEAVKGRAAQLRMPYDGTSVTRAIESALAQSRKGPRL